MSQATAGASGLVDASPSRRAPDASTWCCPARSRSPSWCPSWPAASACWTASTVYGGYRLVTQEGRELAGDAGLIMQGVEDGGLLTVAAGVDDAAAARLRRRGRGDDRRRRARPQAVGAGVRPAYRPVGRRPAAGARRGRAADPGHRCWPSTAAALVAVAPRHRRHRAVARPARARGRGRGRLDGLLLRRGRRADVRARRHAVRAARRLRRRRRAGRRAGRAWSASARAAPW